MASYGGQRLVFDGHLCTVRYLGPLQNTKGEWLGVEWDDATRGKHSGTHQGQQIFHCLATSGTAASFIRPTRQSDVTKTLLDAIKHKYGGQVTANGLNGSVNADLIEISGKAVEEVGFQKIRQQLSVIGDLKIVLVDQLKVRGLTRSGAIQAEIKSAQQELARTCPNITELDLGWNPIETWQTVADISAALRRLRIIKASGLRLKSLEVTFLPNGQSPFQLIEELHLNDCLLTPDQIASLLSSNMKSLFPALKILWLSQNELHHFKPKEVLSTHPTVSTIVLENNRFETLECLQDIISHFPNLTNVSLQGNLIDLITFESSEADNKPTLSFPRIESLNLAGNKISNFAFMDSLATTFPNLKSLRMSKNPIYDVSSGVKGLAPTVHSSYYLTLARIPQLNTLNYTDITARDREEGEIYYLSVAEKEARPLLASTNNVNDATTLLKQKYPLYESLCSKYERDSILSPSPQPQTDTEAGSYPTYAPGTLGARLVNATFYVSHTTAVTSPSDPAPELSPPPHTAADHPKSLIVGSSPDINTRSLDPSTFTRSIPTTISVYTLKSLLARHFHLPPLQFRLIYESTELDPVNESTMKSAAFGRKEDNWDDWGDWDVDIPPPATTSITTTITTTASDAAITTEKINGDGSIKENNVNGEEDQEEDRIFGGTGVGGKWIEGILHRNGRKWKKREAEILNGMRPWGDYLENDVKEVRVRIEPFGPRSKSPPRI